MIDLRQRVQQPRVKPFCWSAGSDVYNIRARRQGLSVILAFHSLIHLQHSQNQSKRNVRRCRVGGGAVMHACIKGAWGHMAPCSSSSRPSTLPHRICNRTHAGVVNVAGVCRCARNDEAGAEQRSAALQCIIVDAAGCLIKPVWNRGGTTATTAERALVHVLAGARVWEGWCASGQCCKWGVCVLLQCTRGRGDGGHCHRCTAICAVSSNSTKPHALPAYTQTPQAQRQTSRQAGSPVRHRLKVNACGTNTLLWRHEAVCEVASMWDVQAHDAVMW